MTDSDALNGRDETEETSLVERKLFWTRMDKLLAVFGALINFGHGVETYLPGVITQQISCVTELSEWQEGTLDCILYITLAVALVVSGPLSDWFGRRELLLFSLYLSVLSAVICAIVADYYLLLLSRALIGICIGLSFSTCLVMIAELASEKAIQHDILMIASIMYAIGGVWSAGLGYLLLDLVGWRIFILLTSIPLFIPPIFMLHFIFVGTAGQQMQDEQNQDIPKGTMNVSNFVARTVKLGLFDGMTTFQGWLTILLVPTMIQMLKIKKAEPNSDCSVTVTKGPELLLLGIVTLASAFGMLFRHLIRNMLSFRKSQVIAALLNVVAFTAMLEVGKESLVVIVLSNFVVKFLYGFSMMAHTYILADIDYFGTGNFALGSGISSAMGTAGGVFGTAMVAFTPMSYVIITALVISALNIPLVLSMSEVKLN
ncbi:synaptic vesicle 2-related protein-like [Bolinopsis microptera]|uniref:synaptic vesicle 2-related protein-like n=1 Tax=Bolinopsis microptera TaxID=2820187 RepID=UPI0030799358